MCGICGFIRLQKNAKVLGADDINIMNKKIISRGPDDGRVWIERDGICGLGHRRLSIIDLSEQASQPMSNESGDVVLVFNGEIYNHHELRSELKNIGKYKWKTNHSDTEVIIHAYEQWGIDCIKKFRGMFAFALWDKKKECLYLVRDRIGIKPLYYMYFNGNLIFASEIKALLSITISELQINKRAMYDYLSFLCTPNDETLFKSVHKIRPATWICFNLNGNVVREKYWDVLKNTHTELYKASDKEIQEILLYELQKSINYRKEADVPIGIFLSGGVDSSTNCALFSKGQLSTVKTFCIGYDDPLVDYHNETQYAQFIADYCGAEYYERLLSQEDWIDIVDEITRLLDEPVADPTCVPSYYVSKLARDNGVVVAQVGEGADELFCGYSNWPLYEKSYKYNNYLKLGWPKRIAVNLCYKTGRGFRQYTELIRRASENKPIFWSGAEAFYEYDKKRMISNSTRIELDDYDTFLSIADTYNNFKKYGWEQSNYNWMSYADLNHRLPELLLMRVDKMSMGLSLECRVPFLDHIFVELAMSIPAEKKVNAGVAKKILKDSVRGIIPDDIIDRKKKGFGIPIKGWLNDRLGKKMKDTILFFIQETDLFNVEYILSIYDRLTPNQLWCLYNLANWWDIYFIKQNF